MKEKTKLALLLIVLFGVVLFLESIFQSSPNQQDSDVNIHIMLFIVRMISMLISAAVFGLL